MKRLAMNPPSHKGQLNGSLARKWLSALLKCERVEGLSGSRGGDMISGVHRGDLTRGGTVPFWSPRCRENVALARRWK